MKQIIIVHLITIRFDQSLICYSKLSFHNCIYIYLDKKKRIECNHNFSEISKFEKNMEKIQRISFKCIELFDTLFSFEKKKDSLKYI